MTHWQPIDTAPDTPKGVILLYCPPPGEGVTAGYRGGLMQWRGWHDDYLDVQPTHWMPLPDPPTG